MKKLIAVMAAVVSFNVAASPLGDLNAAMTMKAESELTQWYMDRAAPGHEDGAIKMVAYMKRKHLNPAASSAVKSHTSCLKAKRDFLVDQNALTDAEVKKGAYSDIGWTAGDLRELNSIQADYIGYKCMSLRRW